ncbi:MAG: phosphate ABC transporter permease PtsA [Deltaproteobacteria bacterium]|nr:MAG: phosphate ABC transporter permease PtsA [Deltaproteobacteria bacterium]
MKRGQMRELIAFWCVRMAIVIIVAALGIIIWFLGKNGLSILSWEFLTEPPREGMTEGGIFPPLVGTLYLILGTIICALPLGVLAAIYLTEYTRQGKVIRVIRLGINNLAGVPSVVFGLFGLAFFVIYLGFGVSILSGSLTLTFMILPTIIRASEEALLAVPQTFREASLALGATRWQTIYKVVLPQAFPGILTGSILGIGRAAGETAPIIFTAATFYTPHLPRSIFDPVMALPFHLYVLATEGTHLEKTLPIQYGTAIVLLGLVLGINLAAIVWRARLRRKKRW